MVHLSAVENATSEQRATLEQVVRDLNVLLPLTEVRHVRVEMWSDMGGCKGLWTEGARGKPDHVMLVSSLVGGKLYAVWLHELGHALGLDHTPAGIMAPKEQGRRALTRANRRKWCLDVAAQVQRLRAKEAIR